MTTEDIIELVALAHMAGQHYKNSDLDNASYGDARAYAIHTAVPKITAHNSDYEKGSYDKRKYSLRYQSIKKQREYIDYLEKDNDILRSDALKNYKRWLEARNRIEELEKRLNITSL